MTTTTIENKQEPKFDKFGYVKRALLQGYVKALLNKEDTKEFSFEIKNYEGNSSVIYYWFKQGALKIADVKSAEVSDEYGHFSRIYTVTVKDFNIDCKAKSKEGKEFRLFDLQTLGLALLRANK